MAGDAGTSVKIGREIDEEGDFSVVSTSYAVGDALLGTNPVSSEPDSVLAVELTLKDLLVTFGIDDDTDL